MLCEPTCGDTDGQYFTWQKHNDAKRKHNTDDRDDGHVRDGDDNDDRDGNIMKTTMARYLTELRIPNTK